MPADPPSSDFIMRNAMDAQEVAVGWWPGDARYGKAALYAYAHPAPEGFAAGTLSPPAARWEPALGEYILDWEEVCSQPDAHAVGLQFARSAFQRACLVCGWDPALPASAEGAATSRQLTRERLSPNGVRPLRSRALRKPVVGASPAVTGRRVVA